MDLTHLRNIARPPAAVNPRRIAPPRVVGCLFGVYLLSGCEAPELPGARTGAEGIDGVPDTLKGPFRAGGLRPGVRALSPLPAGGATRVGDLALRERPGAGGPRPPVADPDTSLDRLTAPVEGAELVGDPGWIEEALEAAREERRPVDTWGAAALSQAELFGDGIHPGACALPMARYTAEHGGEAWEITLAMALWENFVGTPEIIYNRLTSGCEDALLEAGGDVEAAMDGGGCQDLEIEMILPEGSACRTCVEGSAGDLAGCVEAGSCAEEAPEVIEIGGDYWNRAEVDLLACAPDYTAPVVLAGDFSDGELADPFDVAGWGYICAPFWSEESRSVEYGCQGGYAYDPEADTARVGVHGLVEGMRRDPADLPSWSHRNYYTPRVVFRDGTEIRWAWEAYLSLGMMIEEPDIPDFNGDGVVDAGDEDYGYGYFGWGLNPTHLRPDGSDPLELDDTYARDWLGGIAMKTATTRTGVYITMANRSRCAEGAWEDPDGDGVLRCRQMDVPVGGYLNDGAHFWWIADYIATMSFPVATLASTGLPDPDIPGGVVPWVAGSPTLADPDFDGCSWGHSFTPDRVPYPDIPADYDGPASLWGDGWNFGGHDGEADGVDQIRIVLSTNEARRYCPTGEVP